MLARIRPALVEFARETCQDSTDRYMALSHNKAFGPNAARGIASTVFTRCFGDGIGWVEFIDDGLHLGKLPWPAFVECMGRTEAVHGPGQGHLAMQMLGSCAGTAMNGGKL